MAQEERVHMGLSVKAMIFHAGRLLVLQKNDPEGLHHWEFPGGGLRRDEDFAMAVHREVMEETGLSEWCHFYSRNGYRGRTSFS